MGFQDIFWNTLSTGYMMLEVNAAHAFKGHKKSLKIPKGVIRIRKSLKDRQRNGQKKEDKQHM